jgi:hypothetical protein
MRYNGYFSKRINSATTTQVKVGPSRIVRIVGLTPATGTTTIIDGDGTTNVTLGVLTWTAASQSVELDIRVTNGIRITSSGTDDILVVYE